MQRGCICSLQLVLLLASWNANAESQGPASAPTAQGIYANLDSQPTFKEENYLNDLTERSRYTDAADFTYDFPAGEGDQTIGVGGDSRQVELGNKPSLARTGAMSQSLFHLKACGLNVPHLHPRAAKVLYMLEGTVSLGFVEEGMGRVIAQNLTAGQSFIFPEGLAMWVHNLECEDALYLDTWSSPDPGILSLVPALMRMPIPTIAAAFNIDTASAEALVARSRSPIEQGPAECLARCNATSPAGSPAAAPGLFDSQAPSVVSASSISTLTTGAELISTLP